MHAILIFVVKRIIWAGCKSYNDLMASRFLTFSTNDVLPQIRHATSNSVVLDALSFLSMETVHGPTSTMINCKYM